MRLSLPFCITVLEWYEFTIYNALIPYGIFGGTSGNYLQLGFLILALSFIARPLGSIYFSSISNRTNALRNSLLIMSISTLLMASFNSYLDPIRAIWFGILKIMQGFAIGGSYGLSSLAEYDAESRKEKPRFNYRLAIINTGWVWGMLFGDMTVFMVKLLIGNNVWDLFSKFNISQLLQLTPSAAFIEFGWRIPLVISGLIGTLLYIKSLSVKDEVVKLPAQNKVKYIAKYIWLNPLKFIAIFAVVALDMVICHLLFTYADAARSMDNAQVSNSLLQTMRWLLIIILTTGVGRATDSLNRRLGGHAGNKVVLGLTCIALLGFAQYSPWSSPIWILLNGLVAALYFGSVGSWVISRFDKVDRQIIIGPLFNIAASLVGSTTPLIATMLSSNGLRWFLTAYAGAAIFGLLTPTTIRDQD